MRGEGLELGIQIGLALVYLAGASLASLVGVLVEYQSYLHLLAGDYTLAAWMAALGAIALLFSYRLTLRKALPQLR